MFSAQIVNADSFLEMPMTSQALYFHLGMSADDDGFVSPRKVLRMTGAGEDDLKVLLSKGYVIPFESGVIVITHWKQNNYIQSDRYTPSIYGQEKERLSCFQNVYRLDTSRIQNGYALDTQVERKGGKEKEKISSKNEDSIGPKRLDEIFHNGRTMLRKPRKTQGSTN